jgi:hypothetical protein
MQQWEYLHISVAFEKDNTIYKLVVAGTEMLSAGKPVSALYDYLNKLVEEGWEIANPMTIEYFFRRPKQ